VAGVPALVKAGATVITFLRRKECRSATARHQQERQAPAQEALAPPGPVPAATKKRATRHAREKPLAAEPGPAAAVGRKARAGNLAGVTAEPTPRKWYPLHETSLNDATACRHISHLVEIRKECLAKCVAVGATHSCYECGQPGHWSHGCPSKVPFSGRPGSLHGIQMTVLT
jgi:hypothetical protein